MMDGARGYALGRTSPNLLVTVRVSLNNIHIEYEGNEAVLKLILFHRLFAPNRPGFFSPASRYAAA